MTRRIVVMLAAAAFFAVGAAACHSSADSASAARAQARWRAEVAAAKAQAARKPPPKETPFGNMALPTLDQMPKAKGHAYRYRQMAGAAVIVLIMALVTYWVTKRYPSRRE